MNEALLFYATITIFGLIYIALAMLPKKHIKTKTDYFLAGRNLGVFKATCTLIATQLGAGLILGTSQQAFKMGLYGLLFTAGVSIGLIILGCGVAGRLRAMNIVTTTQIFEKKYHSPFLRKVASILVTITLCGILVGNMVASKSLMHSLGFQNDFFYLLFWFFTIVYTMIGGLHAVVLTDLVQVSFISIIFIGLTFYSLWAFPPAFSWHALQAAQATFTGQLPPLHDLVIILVMPALFALFEQDLAQIFFASKTKNVATVTAILTTIFILTFGLIPIYLGMQAHLLGISVTGDHSPLLEVVKHITGPFMVVMIGVGILAAIASTADALLCAIGANITQDFSLSFLGLTALVKSKTVTFASGIIVLGASYLMPTDIISILVKSYEIPVSCLLIPIVAAYIFSTVRKYAGIGGLAGGAIGLIAFHTVIHSNFQSLYILGLSLIGYLIGYFLQPLKPAPISQKA